MLVSDVMKTNVINIPSNTSLAEARRIMDAHDIRRLPVIDRNVLVGIVTKDDLDKMGPSQLTTFSVNELVYMLNKITVKDVMHKEVVTAHPDTTLEEAMALAESRKVGSLVVVENDRVVGIVTATAIITAILNPLLGLGLPGSRIIIVNCFNGPDIEKVISTINKLGVGIKHLFTTEFPEANKHDLIVHLETDNPQPVADAIQKLGFRVVIRKR